MSCPLPRPPRACRRRPLAVVIAAALAAAAPSVQAQQSALSEITVTGTREGQKLSETPASIGIVAEDAIKLVKPSHPSQILSQVPGAAAGVTNGEGHNTAIRQPFTTNPVYLFLEDGIPTRSTGFFNHNGLYEVNLPQSGGVEVVRGPGTALYGSDAIGGVVNILTQAPPKMDEFSLLGELGSFGWQRLLVSGGNAGADDGWRLSGNLTSTAGWRDKTAYDRRSVNLRWDHAVDANTVLKTVVSHTKIDQETGANSPLSQSDYENKPTLNYKPIAYRKVGATRISLAWERETGDTLWSVTPYFRDNSMDLLASFTLAAGATADNTVYTSSNRSLGVQAKWRKDFSALRGRLIAGVDIDHSPGGRKEDRINVATSVVNGNTYFNAYTLGARVYDYKVTFRGISPYVHGEISPSERLRLSAGLRHDHVGFDFENNIGVATVTATRVYGQAGNTSVSYDHLSPKLGATYALSADTHLFGSLNHGFRAPSESQLFRPNAANNAANALLNVQNALALKPVKADQAEIGLRGKAGALSYDLSLYRLNKRDDILAYTLNNVRISTNNGSTRHRGVEAALGMALTPRWRADVAFSHARHHYRDWLAGGTDLSGKEIAAAPRSIANTRLSWTPEDRAVIQLEWSHIGSYWVDDANTGKYAGHNLLNLRGGFQVGKDLRLSAAVSNLADRRYADSVGGSGAAMTLSPGLPRTVSIALEATW